LCNKLLLGHQKHMNTFCMVFAVAWRKPDAAQIEVSFLDQTLRRTT